MRRPVRVVLLMVLLALAVVLPATPAAAAVPGAPAGVTLTPAIDGFDFTITPPSNDGGSAVFAYRITYAGQTFDWPNTTGTLQVCYPPTTPTPTCPAPGSYSITVAAVNNDGAGPTVTSNTATSFSAPTAPAAPTATPTASGITVTWTAPSSDGGTPVLGYLVATGGVGRYLPAGTTSTTFDDLTPGTIAAFNVRAWNGQALGAASPASSAVTVPADRPIPRVAVLVRTSGTEFSARVRDLAGTNSLDLGTTGLAGTTPGFIEWSPDATKVAFARKTGANYTLVVADARTGASTSYPVPASILTGVAWSPDSGRIAYLAQDLTTIPTLRVLNLGNGATATVASDAAWAVSDLAWRPGTEEVALALFGDSVVLVRADTGAQNPVAVAAFGVRFTSDGATMLTHGASGANGVISRVALPAETVTPVTTVTGATICDVDLTDDDSTVAFSSGPGSSCDAIARVALTGGAVTDLTPTGVSGALPGVPEELADRQYTTVSVSPYGDRVAAPSCSGGGCTVPAEVLAMDGSGSWLGARNEDIWRIELPPASDVVTSRFVPAIPTRWFDTRVAPAPTGVVAATTSIDVAIGGVGGVPANATAVVLNVTAAAPSAKGFLTVWPTGAPRPLASSVNFAAGQNTPNLVTVPIGADGSVSFYAHVDSHIVVDVVGWYEPAATAQAGRFVSLTPSRLFDTRDTTAIAADGTRTVDVTGSAGVPASGVAAVVMNVASTGAPAKGSVTVYAGDASRPGTANLNTAVGETVSNLVIAPVGADGTVAFYSSAGTHLVVDVTGYITDATSASSDAGLFVPLTAFRAFDTRTAPAPVGVVGTTPISVDLAGLYLVPDSASAVAVNITGIQATAKGFVTAWPSGLSQPLASTLNLAGPGATRGNAAMLALGGDGALALITQNGAHLTGDVAGWFTS
ncbi:MAG: fibronectin type III domain-containing protein [Acidimicrobiales bacterium]|nr:fibronectin type III domain-containing protein [Acidimicrobiales bacterium]